MMRATTSVDPPGGNGTISVICRDGQVCARAMPAQASSVITKISFRICKFFLQGLVGALLVREDATDLRRCPRQGSDLINVVRSRDVLPVTPSCGQNRALRDTGSIGRA